MKYQGWKELDLLLFFFFLLKKRSALTLELRVEASAPVVAVRREVQPQPVLAADHGGRQVRAGQPAGGRRDTAAS